MVIGSDRSRSRAEATLGTGDEDARSAPVEGIVGALTGPHRKWLLFLLLLVLFGVTSTWQGRLVNDVRVSSAQAWLLATHGTLDVREVGVNVVGHGVETSDGGLVSDRLPGAWLPAVPAYLLAPGMDVELDPDRHLDTQVPVWPAAITAAALVAGALVVLHEVLRGVFNRRRALGVTLVAGLGSSVWGVAADGMWTHTTGVLVLAAALHALQRERYWMAGGWFGIAMLVRPTHAFTALGVGVCLAIAQREWRRLPEIGVPSAAGLGVMSLYSKSVFDTWLPIGGYDSERIGAILGADEAMTGDYTMLEQLTGTLFDPYHGLLLYSPFLVVCILFFAHGWRRSPAWARAATIGGLLYWAAQLRGNRFTGGSNFFGPRFPIEPLWLMTVTLASAWFVAMQRTVFRYIGLVTVTIALTINALGAAMFGARYESRGGIDWATSASVEASE